MTTRQCVIYARISIKSDESVSIDRQIEASQQYAAARGWQVVEVFIDDGVSATKNRPEDRAGWSALLASPKKFDSVIIWKVDRLSRRTLDFLHADATLRERKAGLVAVDDPVDMTTAQGRGFATMLAVFGEMEAAAISTRVKAARSYLIRAGRLVGGRVPYGWQSVPNPDGAGLVLAQDPDRIDYVRGMVDRVLRGGSIYSVVQWLDEVNAPTVTGVEKWSYSTVERLIRHPVLAGMTPFNPNSMSSVRGPELLRDTNGLPAVNESVAIMPVPEWRAMVKALDERDSAQSVPRSLKSKTSALLSGLVYCGEHRDNDGNGTRMYRGTVQGRHGYHCPVCYMVITNFEDYVVAEFLRAKGERVRWSVVQEIHEGGAAMLPEIELALDDIDRAIRQASDHDTRLELQGQQANLLDLRDEKRSETPIITQRWVGDTQTFGEDWDKAATVEDRRAVLDDALHVVWVVRGRTGRRTASGIMSRLVFEWKMPEDLGPIEVPDDETLASWAE